MLEDELREEAVDVGAEQVAEQVEQAWVGREVAEHVLGPHDPEDLGDPLFRRGRVGEHSLLGDVEVGAIVAGSVGAGESGDTLDHRVEAVLCGEATDDEEALLVPIVALRGAESHAGNIPPDYFPVPATVG